LKWSGLDFIKSRIENYHIGLTFVSALPGKLISELIIVQKLMSVLMYVTTH